MGELSRRNEALILVAKTQLGLELLKISACETKSINQENKSVHFNFFLEFHFTHINILCLAPKCQLNPVLSVLG